MKTNNQNNDFLSELEKRVDMINKSNSLKLIGKIDYVLVVLFLIAGFFVLIFGWFV